MAETAEVVTQTPKCPEAATGWEVVATAEVATQTPPCQEAAMGWVQAATAEVAAERPPPCPEAATAGEVPATAAREASPAEVEAGQAYPQAWQVGALVAAERAAVVKVVVVLAGEERVVLVAAELEVMMGMAIVVGARLEEATAPAVHPMAPAVASEAMVTLGVETVTMEVAVVAGLQVAEMELGGMEAVARGLVVPGVPVGVEEAEPVCRLA